MIGFYDYTVILTYLGFSSGMIGIFLAITGNTFWAVMCLMFSGLCDMFDGRVARTKKKRTNEERHFGIQLDSLSDLVCFGVLPAIIGYSLGIKCTYLVPLIIIYPLAALIRLAYFNVLEITRNSSTPVKEYTGLPVTSSALIFPLDSLTVEIIFLLIRRLLFLITLFATSTIPLAQRKFLSR